MYSYQAEDLSLYQILINECRVYGSAAGAAAELNALYQAEQTHHPAKARELLTAAVEKLSGGENTVLFDDAGVPSVMVRVPAIACAELLADSRTPGLHPAFRCGKKRIREIWFSKYLNTVVANRAASLPLSIPYNARNFEQAAQRVASKGAGWQLVPFQLRMAIALKCLRDGVSPSGNTDVGHDYYALNEVGVMTPAGTVLTGSGPSAWTHNGRPEGIWDMVGNLNEWDCGLRLVNGEIQLMDMETLLRPGCDLGASSPMWRAMDAQGQLVAPGTPGALHFDGGDGFMALTTRAPKHHGLVNCAFCDVTTDGQEPPELLRLLGLYPPRRDLPETAGWRWITTDGEAVSLSGGAFRIMNHSGIFFLGITKPRDADYALSGLRTIYVSPGAMEEESQ